MNKDSYTGFTSEKSKVTTILRNLKKEPLKYADAKLVSRDGKKYTLYINDEEKTSIFPTLKEGDVYEEDITRLVEPLSEKLNKKQEEIYAELTKENIKRKGLEKKVINFAFVLFSLSFLFFFLEKMKITGFIVNNVPDSTLNIGILICALMAFVLYKSIRK